MALLSTVSRTQSGNISGGTGSNFLSYPKELGTMDRHKHYVMFFINQQENSQVDFSGGVVPEGSGNRTEATTLQVKRAPTKRLAQAIALYMPAQISLQHQANYGEAEIGALVAGLGASVANFANTNDTDGIMDAIKRSAGDLYDAGSAGFAQKMAGIAEEANRCSTPILDGAPTRRARRQPLRFLSP